LVDVRQVNHYAQAVATAYERPPRVCEAGAGVGRTGESKGYALAKRVGPAPHRAERAQTSLVEYLQRTEVRVNRLRALKVQKGRHHVRLNAPGQFIRRAHHL